MIHMFTKDKNAVHNIIVPKLFINTKFTKIIFWVLHEVNFASSYVYVCTVCSALEVLKVSLLLLNMSESVCGVTEAGGDTA